MATSRHISYCEPRQDKTTQHETYSKIDFDDGSKTLAELEKIVEKVTTMELWINREGKILDKCISNYQKMKKKFEEDITGWKLQLLSLLRKQEEKTRELKKLNLIIFETGDESFRRTDEQSKWKAESIFYMATNKYITVQWATQLEYSLPGMRITRVRFFTQEDKAMVLAGKMNLFQRGIYLDHDMTKRELEMEKNVHKMAEEARRSGKTTFVSGNTVCIDGTYHTFV